MSSVDWTQANHSVLRIVIAGLSVVGLAAFCSLTIPSAEADYAFPDLGVTITVGHHGGDRYLEVVSSGEKLTLQLTAEWGPGLRANLYRDGNTVWIIDIDSNNGFAFAPLRQLSDDSSAASWTYLGSFMRTDTSELSFVDAAGVPECMDTFMDQPFLSQPRQWIYHEKCGASAGH
ncbi:MAG: hypothetical protein JWR51_4227 [Devosia sp.]|uniref:hypothetical protein n=1 Tax=Devosia sp. TaxID=1871048 RepID=UPI002634273D|nr:hypothetical protein [Devosia sp.]MDB5531124.1 hypothetical protein [Devosia sp.]